jgi:hypothetical protein
MNTETLSAKAKAALLASIECSIDMYNDMALDPMYLQVNEVRELATMSDDEIRAKIRENANEADKNIDMLIELELLRAELTK